MSRRRKRESDSEVREKPVENTEKEATEKTKAVKSLEMKNMRVILYSLVIAAVFFISGFLISPVMTGNVVATAESGDQFIFISPPGCTKCEELEPMAKEIANTLGVPFVKTGYGQQMETPGFSLIYEDEYLGATGFDSEYTLKVIVCQMSGNGEICERAEELAPAEEPTTPPPTPDIPKSDRPEAHAFVMSYCPYGLQFIKAYVPVIELLGDKADVELNFVHYLMHGEDEMTENTRMYCIQKEQKEKFTDYLRCFVVEGDWEGCISEVGIDSGKLDACMEATDAEFEITKTFQESEDRYPRYGVDAALAEQYGVGGSPTFGINGQQVQVNRSPEAIKQAICAAFNSPPEECSQTLSATAEAPSFGPVGSGSGSASQAQC